MNTPTTAPPRVPLSLAIICLATFITSVDRLAFPVLIEPIKLEFGLSDTQLGLLTGFAFTAMYAMASIPMARWADVGDRRLIVGLSMGVWSLMTATCGLAQSGWQLFVARFGVGFGEAGSVAPAQSLIADWYAPARRTFPLALFALAATLGGSAGYILVGGLADHFGWRNTLLILGLPGLLVALLIRALVVEPRGARTSGVPAAAAAIPFRSVIAALLRKRALVHITIAWSIWGFAAYGIFSWLPSFFVRAHGISLSQFGLWMGLVTAGASGVGMLLGGWLGNRLLGRDLRWGMWLPAGAASVYAGALLGALLAPTVALAFVFFALTTLITGLVGPMVLTIVSGLAGQKSRAVSLALMGLLSVLVGGGLGPLIVGAASDALQARYGADSLRYGLALMTPMIAWTSVHFWLASRHLRAEFEDQATPA